MIVPLGTYVSIHVLFSVSARRSLASIRYNHHADVESSMNGDCSCHLNRLCTGDGSACVQSSYCRGCKSGVGPYSTQQHTRWTDNRYLVI